MAGDERLDLIWGEAVRSIEVQRGMIDEARSRAGTILSASSIVAAFLGAAALNDKHAGGWRWVGVGAFVGIVLACAFVLWPRNWTFVLSPRKLISGHVDRPDGNDLDQFRWSVATEIED